jgi:hypothetical protein
MKAAYDVAPHSTNLPRPDRAAGGVGEAGREPLALLGRGDRRRYPTRARRPSVRQRLTFLYFPLWSAHSAVAGRPWGVRN